MKEYSKISAINESGKGYNMNINEFYNKLDELFQSTKDVEKLDAYLCDSLAKASEEKDYGSYVTIGNEMIGFYRGTAQYDKCFRISEDTLMLMEELQLDDSEHFATTLLNVAAAYCSAGRLNESLSYYARALQVYEQILEPFDKRFAELYNNISVLLEQLNDNEKSVMFGERALEVIMKYPEAVQEQAAIRTGLALSKLKIGDVDAVEVLLKEAIVQFEGASGDTASMHYFAALSGMAELYCKKGEYQLSAEYYEKAALKMKQVYGENDSYQLLVKNAEIVRQHL